MKSPTLFATSRNQERVYLRDDAHAQTHFNDTPGLEDIVRKILKKSTLEGESLYFETKMGRVVGTSDLVQNMPGDEIIYAMRLKRDNYTAFNMTQKSTPCSSVVIILNKIDGNYGLESAWIGSKSPSFPGDPHETPDSKQFWSTHSLAWGSQPIQPGTETTTCPW